MTSHGVLDSLICLEVYLCELNLCFFVQHYTELPDIKRVIVNTHAIEPQVCISSLAMQHPGTSL